MPLFLVSHYDGFVGWHKRTANVRLARTFTSFEAADTFAKNIPLTVYAVLQTVEQPYTLVDQLREKYGEWGEHLRYPVDDWNNDVDSDNTRQGYWDWVASQTEQEEHEHA